MINLQAISRRLRDEFDSYNVVSRYPGLFELISPLHDKVLDRIYDAHEKELQIAVRAALVQELKALATSYRSGWGIQLHGQKLEVDLASADATPITIDIDLRRIIPKYASGLSNRDDYLETTADELEKLAAFLRKKADPKKAAEQRELMEKGLL